jgi:hypothetical protein
MQSVARVWVMGTWIAFHDVLSPSRRLHGLALPGYIADQLPGGLGQG